MRRGKFRWTLILALACCLAARAEDAPAHQEVIERYEQILERSPVEGPSFDKLLQIYQEGEGLEKLDERWTPWSAQSGAKGATYSLLRGLLADRMGKTDAARKLLQTATQDAPDDFHVWMALGDFEFRQGKWTDAIAALQKGLGTTVTGDDRLALYRKLGQAQQRNLDVPAALATWQKMVEEFPKDSFALEETGGAELDADQFDEAKKTFQKLVDLTEPNSMARAQALMHLAEVDDRQGKTEAAVHDYEAILPLTADGSWLNREVRAQIEAVYRREDDLAGLVTYYQKWTQDNPKDVEALLLLAATLNELGKKPEALDVLRKVTTLAPDRHEVRASFGQALVDAKKYDEAITVLTALTADDPTEPRYWETMGDALWLKTQPATPESKKAVLDAWGHIAPADSKDVAAMLRVADLCRDHGLNDEALAGYQRALTLSPDASDIREKAVKLLVDMKRPDDAWKLLDAMTDGAQATAANYLKLATLDQQFDRKDAVEAAIQKGLALEPGNFDLLSMEWTRLAEAQKWSDCVALFDKLLAAAPNSYFADQLEARQVQALTSAGMLDDTEKKLHTKLGADPGLTESELRLLLRILISKSDPDIAKAIDESHKRFPQSVSLMQIEIDYDRHVSNYDGAVTALQKLIETVPQQKSDWLGEIVRIRRDQGNMDEALKTAQGIIDASPASADGYLLYADIALAANKPDAAVEKLQAAIKLSDKPNDVRQRLARYYMESGQAGKARTIYDEAFAAADNPQDKLTIVRAMATAYFQDGQIDELINRFKKEQGSEEGGWRYGLYLSAIDEQVQDYGGARRELAKSLAVRPNDAGLLHSLVGLADRDGDRGELLRYREMLAQADPTQTNEIALANEYAIQEKPEDAWRIVQQNLTEVGKDPLAWKDVLNQTTDPAYAAKVKSVLEQAIRTKGDSFEGKFALAQFQLQQGDLSGAQATLWDILAQPLPPAPPATAPTTTATPRVVPGMLSAYNIYQTPYMQRAQQSYVALNEIQQLLASGQRRNMMQQQLSMARMYSRMGVSTTLGPEAIRDHSLIYLSFLAVQQKQPAEFLKELEDKIEAWHWGTSDRLLAYTLIQAREPLLAAIEEQAKSTTPDRKFDEFAYLTCQSFLNLSVDDPLRKRAEAAQTTLSDRLESDPQFKTFAVMMKINRLAADTSADGVAKRNAAVSDYLKTIDHKDSAQLVQGIELGAQTGNWVEIKSLVDELAATDPAQWNVTMNQQIAFLPQNLLQQAANTKETMPKEVIPTVMRLLQLSYPATPPQPTLPTGQTVGPGGMMIRGLTGGIFYNNSNQFPPANRYFPLDRIGNLEPMYQQLKARSMLPDMYAALDQQEKDLTDWHKIYPQLIRIYFQWWDGKHDDAIASVRKLMAQDSSDDWKTLLASMLTQEQKYDDAIPVLESVSARYGPDFVQTQKQLMHVARLAKNNDVAQKAALKLLALHLPVQEQMQMMDDLRNIGLKDKADEIMNRQIQGRTPGGTAVVNQSNNGIILQTLSKAVNSNIDSVPDAKALEIARQVLRQDPLAPMQFGNEAYIRTLALGALKKSGMLDDYTQDIGKQLAATPDSVRLNYLAGEAWSAMGDTSRETRGLLPGYHWLKLQRTGNKFAFSTSLDGTMWSPMADITMDLPAKLYAGAWVTARPAASEMTFDQIALTGTVTPANPPSAFTLTATPTSSTPGATVPTTAPLSGTTAPASSIAPWQQIDIWKVIAPGSAVFGKDPNSLVVNGGTSEASPTKEPGRFVYQMLEGDGSIAARIADIYAQPDKTSGGLVLRETFDPQSREVAGSVSLARGVVWQEQGATSESSTGTAHPEFSLPAWFKLARKGNQFTASYSKDGQTWAEIFSRQGSIDPDAEAGLFVTGEYGAKATWSEVKLNGVALPPPASGTLSSPWESFDIGAVTTPVKITGTANGLSVEVSSGGPYDKTNEPVGTYVCAPVKGDGEIVARLDDLSPHADASAVAALCFRNGKAQDASDVHFIFAAMGETRFYSKMDALAQSVHYYKRVAELDPKNQSVLVTVAQQLRQAHKPEAAADLYTTILKADFVAGMAQWNNVEGAFEEANRLPDFIKIIQAWSPPPLNPMGGGGGQDMYFVLVQVANQLKQNNHLPEAEQVLRKALTVETFQPKQDGVTALAQLLLAQDRRDEAAAEVEKWILEKKAPPPPAPILGFNVQVQVQNNWFQSVGWSSNGVIMSPIIPFLQLADSLGLSTKLRQELMDRAAKTAAPTTPGAVADPNQMAAVLLAIIARDPSYKPELEKLLKDYPLPTSPAMGVNTNGFLIIAQQLEKWPQERLEAMKIASAIYAATNNGQGNMFPQNIVVIEVQRLAEKMGDQKLMQDLLRKQADAMRQARAVNPNQVQLDPELKLARQLIQQGMLKEAAAVLEDAKTDPQMLAAGNGNNYFKGRVDEVANQLNFAKGDKGAVAFVYGLRSKPGKNGPGTEIFWQLNGETRDIHNSVYFSHTTWDEGGVSRPTTYGIVVSGGPDQQHLTMIASFKNVATHGSGSLKIPPGTLMIRADLVDPNGPGAMPSPAAQPTVATGQVLVLGGAENLLKNPDFQVVRDAAGVPVVAGWHGLTASGIAQETGGPLVATGSGVMVTSGPLVVTGYQTLDATNNNMGNVSEIVSDKIAIQPNTNYILGGWMRLNGNLGYRYLDASGKVLNPNQSAVGANDTGWEWRAWCLQGDPSSGIGGDSMPPGAAFLQLVLRLNQDSDFSGLFIKALTAPAAK